MSNSGTLILVVDDELPVREMVCSFLSRKGYQTVEAVEGQAALDVLQTTSVDLVLTDLRMPGMDGVSLTRAIKERYPSLGTVVMSGYVACEELRDELEEVGVDAILEKPFMPEELLAALAIALAQGEPK